HRAAAPPDRSPARDPRDAGGRPDHAQPLRITSVGRGRRRQGPGPCGGRGERPSACLPGRGLRGERTMNKTQTALAVQSELALKAALALVELIPSDVPLAVRGVEPAGMAPSGAGVVANVVGAVSAELVTIVGETVDRALGGAGGASVSLADA